MVVIEPEWLFQYFAIRISDGAKVFVFGNINADVIIRSHPFDKI